MIYFDALKNIRIVHIQSTIAVSDYFCCVAYNE